MPARPPDCNSCCIQCPDYSPYDPYGAPATSYGSPTDPPEPSDARRRAIIDEIENERALIEETFIEGIPSASVSVSSSSLKANNSANPGCRQIQIQASPATPGPWTAGIIFWDDTGYSYDPSVGGSISAIQSFLSVRLTDVRAEVPEVFPRINYGVVIEQDGVRYYSADSFVNHPTACWARWGGGARDTAHPHHVARPPKIAEGRYVSGGMPGKFGRCDGWLFESDGAGSFLVDNTPDISYDRISRPVTKFGIWIALTGEYFDDPALPDATPAGDYLLDMLVDNLWLQMNTWGVYRIAASDVGAPFNFGTTLIDEDLTTIPAWTQSGLPIIDSNDDSEQCWNMDTAKLVDGYLGQNSVSGGSEYDSFRIGSTFPKPQTDENFQLVIDFTWHTIRDRDHVDATQSGDPEESRRVDAGIWLDNLFRLTVWREGAAHEHLCGMYGYTMVLPTMGDGGSELDYTIEGTPATGGDCDYHPAPEVKNITGATCGSLTDLAQGFSRPLDGDRVTVIVRKHYTDAQVTEIQIQNAAIVAGGVKCLSISRIYPEASYAVFVYVNGRQARAGGGVSGSKIWGEHFWFPGNDVTFGLLGLCGGRISDFRIRSRSS